MIENGGEIMEERKKEFLVLFQTLINREGKDELLDWLEHSDFFTAPASTRFHGNHEGGLLEHSLNVYHSLVSLLAQANLKDCYSDETVAIVSLLHDVCKVNYYKKGPVMSKKMACGFKKKYMRLTRNSHVGMEKNLLLFCKTLLS